VPKALDSGHAHPSRSLAQGGIDVHDGCTGIPDDRQLRIKDKSDDCRKIADALADQRQDRNQQLESAIDGIVMTTAAI